MSDIGTVDTSSYGKAPSQKLEEPFSFYQDLQKIKANQNTIDAGTMQNHQKRVELTGQALIPLMNKLQQTGDVSSQDIMQSVGSLAKNYPDMFGGQWAQQVTADLQQGRERQWLMGHLSNNPMTSELIGKVLPQPTQVNAGSGMVFADANPRTNPNAANQSVPYGLSPDSQITQRPITDMNGTRNVFGAGIYNNPELKAVPNRLMEGAPQSQPTSPTLNTVTNSSNRLMTGSGNYPSSENQEIAQGRSEQAVNNLRGGINPNIPLLTQQPTANDIASQQSFAEARKGIENYSDQITPIKKTLEILKKIDPNDTNIFTKNKNQLLSALSSLGVDVSKTNLASMQELSKYLAQNSGNSFSRSDLDAINKASSSPNETQNGIALKNLLLNSLAQKDANRAFILQKAKDKNDPQGYNYSNERNVSQGKIDLDAFKIKYLDDNSKQEVAKRLRSASQEEKALFLKSYELASQD